MADGFLCAVLVWEEDDVKYLNLTLGKVVFTFLQNPATHPPFLPSHPSHGLQLG